MREYLKHSLFTALLWRAALAVAAVGVAVLWLPKPWMVVAVGLAAAVVLAAQTTYALTNSLEAVEPMVRAAFEQVPLREAPYRQMEGIVHALEVAGAESARQMASSAESRRKLEALLDSMQDAVTSVDAAGRIVWANRPMQRLIRESSGTVRAGHSLVQTIRAPEVLRCVQVALEQGKYAEERSVSLPIGRVFAVSASPMPEGGAVVVMKDRTRIEQVERTQREFVANVNHELRTPLTSISGYVEMLLEDRRTAGTFTPQVQEFLQAIQKSARRMGRLTDDLLAMARVDSGEVKLRPKAVKVATLIDETAVAVAGLVKEKGGELSIGEYPEATVVADVDAMVQVMSNLVENALNYGRRPTALKSGDRGPDEAAVVLSARQVEGAVEFCVEDFGQGIPSEHLGRLFERFYRVDKARSRESGGTGLGLAIVKHLVESHRAGAFGGRMWVESELGMGSRFFFTLPVEQGIEGRG